MSDYAITGFRLIGGIFDPKTGCYRNDYDETITLEEPITMSEDFYKARISELEREVESSKQESTRWILASERLPKEDQRVIATWQLSNTIHVGVIHYYAGNPNWAQVTAWQPLPEPYKLKTTLPQVRK